MKAVPFRPETGQLDWTRSPRRSARGRGSLAIGAASNALGTINDVRARRGPGARRGRARLRRRRPLRAARARRRRGARLRLPRLLGLQVLRPARRRALGPAAAHRGARRAEARAGARELRPDRLETGTQNHEGIVGAAAAVDFLASLAEGPDAPRPAGGAFEALHARGQELVERLWSGLRTTRRA